MLERQHLVPEPARDQLAPGAGAIETLRRARLVVVRGHLIVRRRKTPAVAARHALGVHRVDEPARAVRRSRRVTIERPTDARARTDEVTRRTALRPAVR